MLTSSSLPSSNLDDTIAMNALQPTIFTIGHSNHSFEAFSNLLRQHSVDVIADVRSSPYSRYNPHFNLSVLHRMLEDAGIEYKFFGRELGGRPRDRSSYDEHGRVQFGRLASTDPFDDGIRDIMWAADDSRVALMCSEKEPLNCHRTLLIAKALEERGVSVAHILADGSLEAHEATMDRLLDAFKLPHHGDMFRTRGEVIDDAIDRQVSKVAYVDTTVVNADWRH